LRLPPLPLLLNPTAAAAAAAAAVEIIENESSFAHHLGFSLPGGVGNWKSV